MTQLIKQTTWLNKVRYDYTPDFITEEERLEFKDWFDFSLEKGINLEGGMTGNADGSSNMIEFRYTTRMCDPHGVSYPEVAYSVFKRVQEYYDSYVIGSIGRHGMLAVATFVGGDTYRHIDPGSEITFNIVIQSPEEGGVLFIKGTPVTAEEKALHVYAAGRHLHNVNEVKGNRTRYLWVFRLKLLDDEWEPKE